MANRTAITLDMIEDAKRAEDAAREAYNAARVEHKRLVTQRLSDLYGLVVGSTRVRSTRQHLIGVVVAVADSFGVDRKPWIRVQLVRKDGELGALRNWFADWEIVHPDDMPSNIPTGEVDEVDLAEGGDGKVYNP